MTPAPKLTREQKTTLRRLEPVLRAAAKRGDMETAKRITAELQDSLRATGHETRLMQIKNWFFEAAMEAGQLGYAAAGFIGVRKKMRPNTRVYLEATVLLAICYLRQNDIDSSEPLIAEAVKRQVNIPSERRRAQFRRRMIDRFETEWVLATLRAAGRYEAMDPVEVEMEAGRLIQTQADEDILEALGRSTPPEMVERIYRVYDFARSQIPPAEQKYLPSGQERRRQKEVGKTISDSIKTVVWRSLCDPDSELYRLWHKQAFESVINKHVLGAAVVAALSGMTVGWLALAASVTALIFRTGIEVYCEQTRPKSVMIGLDE